MKKLLIISLFFSFVFSNEYCSTYSANTFEKAKSNAIDVLVQDIAVNIESIHTKISKYENNEFSESFNKNVNITNVIDFVPEIKVIETNISKGFFTDDYIVTVCTDKNIIKNKFELDINGENDFILSSFKSINIQNKIYREPYIRKVDILLKKIYVFNALFDENKEIKELINIKNELLKKRTIKVSSKINKLFFENQISENLIKTNNLSNFILKYDYKTNFIKTKNSVLVKLNSYVQLINSNNDTVYSFEYITIGEAKTKEYALNNAFNKFKKNFEKSEIKKILNSIN